MRFLAFCPIDATRPVWPQWTHQVRPPYKKLTSTKNATLWKIFHKSGYTIIKLHPKTYYFHFVRWTQLVQFGHNGRTKCVRHIKSYLRRRMRLSGKYAILVSMKLLNLTLNAIFSILSDRRNSSRLATMDAPSASAI